jgi:hydroxyacylglutathione hydrolase
MILKQYYLNCLAHASYLVGDSETRTAVVVDPQRDIGGYLSDAQQLGLEIRHVFLTHLHADFIAGHLELRESAGAKIYLGSETQAEYPFVPVADGYVLEFGQVRLKVLETPGHTPESISILVYDLAKNGLEPQCVLTGDTLFVGDVGRPDLRASLGWSATELGKMLYRSLREKLLPLPDPTIIYPAHGAGSMCGKSLGRETFSTIGEQRQYNYAVQPMSEEHFLRVVLADQPDAPPYFSYDAVLNARERPTLRQSLERALKPLSLEEVLQLKEATAELLDTRDPAYFAAAYLVDSVNVGLGGNFATWCGTLLDRARPIVIIAEPGREVEAATRLGRIGFDHIAGYLEGGMQALNGRPDLVRRFERLAAATLAEELATSAPRTILDVRTPSERKEKHLPGSLHIPLNNLEKRFGELPRGRGIVVYCATGYRSSVAASLLRQHGIEDVADLAGGIKAWEAAKIETVGSPTTEG